MQKAYKPKEVQEIRRKLIDWLANKRHSFGLLEQQKLKEGWNDPINAGIRVAYEGTVVEIKRLHKLSNKELRNEVEYQLKQSTQTQNAIKQYEKIADEEAIKLSLELQKLQRMTKGRPKGAYSSKNIYLTNLIKRHPNKTAKELYKIALDEAEHGIQNSPFDYDFAEGGILLDGDKELPIINFEDRISKRKSKIRQKP